MIIYFIKPVMIDQHNRATSGSILRLDCWGLYYVDTEEDIKTETWLEYYRLGSYGLLAESLRLLNEGKISLETHIEKHKHLSITEG